MYNVRKVAEDTFWVGGSDRRLNMFENIYPVPQGISYNSYVVLDEKTILLDTVDKAIAGQFFENLEHVLNGRPLDYLVVNHMEPDHCATIGEVVLRYPDVKIVGNVKTFTMMKQFFTFDVDAHSVVIKEGDTLCTGTHTFSFATIVMVHWPECMVTFDQTTGVLFSADAFGTFRALAGNIFADEMDIETLLDEARRYYSNIVGKYGTQTQAALKKIAAMGVKVIAPLHGPIWRDRLELLIEKYNIWSSYKPEEKRVAIFYASIYGDTASVADCLAGKLAEAGEKDIEVFDVSVTDPSYLLAEAFRCDRLVFASPTYNAAIFPKMETFLIELKAHNLQHRKVAIIEQGTWAISSGKLMREIFSSMKNLTVYENTLTIKSALKEAQLADLDGIVSFLVEEG